MLAEYSHFKEQLLKVAPETSMKWTWVAIWGMLYADNAYIGSRLPRGPERIMMVFVEVFGALSLTISEFKNETMGMWNQHAPAMQIAFNPTWLQYCQKKISTYLGVAVTETPNLSAEYDRRIRMG